MDGDKGKGQRLDHPTLYITLHGKPSFVPGRLNYGVLLNGRNQYLDAGQHQDKCLGNLELCNHGFTVAVWLQFTQTDDNTYYLSTGNSRGVKIYFKDGYLNAVFTTNGKVWRVAYSGVQLKKWYFVELSWHPEHGLTMYVNNRIVNQGNPLPASEVPVDVTEHVYIGRANRGDTYDGRFRYANALMDEAEFWYGRREILVAFGWILRGTEACIDRRIETHLLMIDSL
jgi:hypothetical protein